MATYTIIGSDGKEYGSATAEDLRRWVAEGRLNAQSQVKLEGETTFRPLSTFPEFADLFAYAAPATGAPAPFSTGERETAQRLVKGPAIALMVTASIGIVCYLFNTIMILTGNAGFHLPENVSPQMQTFFEGFNRGAHGPLPVIISLSIMAMNGFVLFGAIRMLKLSSHGLAVATAVVAMLPCLGCCCLFGLPFGIWALVVLNKPEVRSQFN